MEVLAFTALSASTLAFLSARRRPPPLSNWAGNLCFSPSSLHSPTTTASLRALVAATPRLRVLGSAHSFSPCASTDGALLRLHALKDVPPPHLDEATGVLWVPGAMTYSQVVSFLRPSRWALHNLASLPHITVAGSIATATHGSGAGNGNLATAVCGLELCTADGGLLTATPASHGDDFFGMVVGLGALGVVLRVGLQLVPAFELAQDVYENLPLEAACAQLPQVLCGGYSVSLFTTWREPLFEQVWRKRHAAEGVAPQLWLGGCVRAKAQLHPIPGAPGEPCTPQLGVVGPSGDRLPHFRAEFQPSAGAELQSEYFVAAAQAADALRAVAGLRARIAPLLHVCEVRAIKGDKLWLSMAEGRDSVAIHFTWLPLESAVRAFLPDLEGVLSSFGARPHWGKVTAIGGRELAARFARMNEFKALREKMDPEGKFRSAWLDEVLGLAAT